VDLVISSMDMMMEVRVQWLGSMGVGMDVDGIAP
jgi:hypothetical protein